MKLNDFGGWNRKEKDQFIRFWRSLFKFYIPNIYEDCLEYEDHYLSYYVSQTKKAICKIIEDELKESGEIKPPLLRNYDSEFITKFRKCKSIKLLEPPRKLSGLYPIKGGFDITISQLDREKNITSKNEKRSVLSHELGHTFEFALNSCADGREPELKTKTPPRNFFDFRPYREHFLPGEHFADEIGRYILMPNFLLAKHIPKKSSLENLIKVCEQFKVPADFAAQRLIHDFDNNSTIFNGKLYFNEPCWQDCLIISINTLNNKIRGYDSNFFSSQFFDGWNQKINDCSYSFIDRSRISGIGNFTKELSKVKLFLNIEEDQWKKNQDNFEKCFENPNKTFEIEPIFSGDFFKENARTGSKVHLASDDFKYTCLYFPDKSVNSGQLLIMIKVAEKYQFNQLELFS